MNFSPVLKKFAAIFGVIFLGALGSGLWEFGMRDILTWTLRTTLTIITFGHSAIRDHFYQEIAAGSIHQITMFHLVITLWVIAFFAGVAAGWLKSRRTHLTEKRSFTDEEREKHTKEIVIVTRIAGWALSLAMVVLAIRVGTLSYVNTAHAHFEQCFTICRPWLPEARRDLVRSEFARVKTKQDYERILAELARVAEQHGVVLPEFIAW